VDINAPPGGTLQSFIREELRPEARLQLALLYTILIEKVPLLGGASPYRPL